MEPTADAAPGQFAEHMRAIANGDRPFPNATGSRHHFVPEFVLRRFRGPTTHGRRLFQLDKTDGTCVETTPGAAGWERDLYAIDSDTGQHDGVVEGLFCLAENYAAGSLRRLFSETDRLSEDDRANIAFLVALQEQRVPGAIDELATRMEEMVSMVAAVEFANLGGRKKQREQAREVYRELTEGKLSLVPNRDAVLAYTLTALDFTAETIRRLPWILFRSEQARFVCSDRPITMHDPTPPHPWSGAAWLSSPNVVATVPLSSTRCLRVSPAGTAPLVVRRAEKQVAAINLRTYGWATRYVYGPSADLLTRLHERALAHPGEVPAATKKRSVICEDAATADPAIAAANVARGWAPYLTEQDADGSFRAMSYRVIDNVEDAMRAVSPRWTKRRAA
jgi:hypothetical protein